MSLETIGLVVQKSEGLGKWYPGDTPDGALMPVDSISIQSSKCKIVEEKWQPSQCLCELVCVAFNVEDLDCFIGRAGRQSASVVVKHGIVLMWYTRSASSSLAAFECSGRIEESSQPKKHVLSYHRGLSSLLLVPRGFLSV